MREVEGLSARYTAKAGLKFSVGRAAKSMTKGNYGRFTNLTAVYLAAVLEYLSTEVLEVAGNAAKDHKSTRIMTNHIQLALKNDTELSRVFGSDTKQDKDTAKPKPKAKAKAKTKGKGKAETCPASYKSLAIQLNNMTL